MLHKYGTPYYQKHYCYWIRAAKGSLSGSCQLQMEFRFKVMDKIFSRLCILTKIAYLPYLPLCHFSLWHFIRKSIPHCILTSFINLSLPVQGSILFGLFRYSPQLLKHNRHSFFVNAPFLWNSTPHGIPSITKVESFHKALRTNFLADCVCFVLVFV